MAAIVPDITYKYGDDLDIAFELLKNPNSDKIKKSRKIWNLDVDKNIDGKNLKNTLKITTAFFTLEDCLTIFLLHLFYTDKTPIKRFKKYIDNYEAIFGVKNESHLQELLNVVSEYTSSSRRDYNITNNNITKSPKTVHQRFQKIIRNFIKKLRSGEGVTTNSLYLRINTIFDININVYKKSSDKTFSNTQYQNFLSKKNDATINLVVNEMNKEKYHIAIIKNGTLNLKSADKRKFVDLLVEAQKDKNIKPLLKKWPIDEAIKLNEIVLSLPKPPPVTKSNRNITIKRRSPSPLYYTPPSKPPTPPFEDFKECREGVNSCVNNTGVILGEKAVECTDATKAVVATTADCANDATKDMVATTTDCATDATRNMGSAATNCANHTINCLNTDYGPAVIPVQATKPPKRTASPAPPIFKEELPPVTVQQTSEPPKKTASTNTMQTQSNNANTNSNKNTKKPTTTITTQNSPKHVELKTGTTQTSPGLTKRNLRNHFSKGKTRKNTKSKSFSKINFPKNRKAYYECLIMFQEIKEQCDSIKKDIRNKNLSKTVLNEKKRAFQEAHRKAQIIDNSSEKDPYLKEIIHHITKNNSLSSMIVGIQKEIDRKLEKFESK
jgi:hypothetical protein